MEPVVRESNSHLTDFFGLRMACSVVAFYLENNVFVLIFLAKELLHPEISRVIELCHYQHAKENSRLVNLSFMQVY